MKRLKRSTRIGFLLCSSLLLLGVSLNACKTASKKPSSSSSSPDANANPADQSCAAQLALTGDPQPVDPSTLVVTSFIATPQAMNQNNSALINGTYDNRADILYYQFCSQNNPANCQDGQFIGATVTDSVLPQGVLTMHAWACVWSDLASVQDPARAKTPSWASNRTLYCGNDYFGKLNLANDKNSVYLQTSRSDAKLFALHKRQRAATDKTHAAAYDVRDAARNHSKKPHDPSTINNAVANISNMRDGFNLLADSMLLDNTILKLKTNNSSASGMQLLDATTDASGAASSSGCISQSQVNSTTTPLPSPPATTNPTTNSTIVSAPGTTTSTDSTTTSSGMSQEDWTYQQACQSEPGMQWVEPGDGTTGSCVAKGSLPIKPGSQSSSDGSGLPTFADANTDPNALPTTGGSSGWSTGTKVGIAVPLILLGVVAAATSVSVAISHPKTMEAMKSLFGGKSAAWATTVDGLTWAGRGIRGNAKFKNWLEVGPAAPAATPAVGSTATAAPGEPVAQTAARDERALSTGGKIATGVFGVFFGAGLIITGSLAAGGVLGLSDQTQSDLQAANAALAPAATEFADAKGDANKAAIAVQNYLIATK